MSERGIYAVTTLTGVLGRARSGEYYLSPVEAQRLAFYVDVLEDACERTLDGLRAEADTRAMARALNPRRRVQSR